MLAVRVPAAVGVNETSAMQYEPAGSRFPFVGQSVLRAKSLGPVSAIVLTDSGPVPVLDNMKAATPFGVEPTSTLPKTVPRPNTLRDRKSTRLNSSHSQISYAVFCL